MGGDLIYTVGMFGPVSTQPPRLTDFPILRLPLLEFVLVGLLAILFFVDMQGSDAASGFLALFVAIPALLFLGIAYLVSLPMQRCEVTDFRIDAIFLVVGAIGLAGWIGHMLIALPLLCCFPVGLSALFRRFVALMLWKTGKGPRLSARKDGENQFPHH